MNTIQFNPTTTELNPDIDYCKFGPISLVVIQPTSFCNLDCDYCYLPHRQLKNRLSLNLIEPIFQIIYTSSFLGCDFTVCWHAGEPLAVPTSFYESAFEIINQADKKYNTQPCKTWHSFQTNGTLINQAWCDFFKQHPVHVGVSIDGPDFIHNIHRKTRTGLGSHASTMRGISYLQKNEIDLSVIAVITEDSLDYPDEIFNFFWENSITDVGFNMEETEGVHQSSSLDKLGIEKRYRDFIKRFWDLTAKTEGEFKVREFESICNLIYDDERLENTDMNKPFVIVSIDNQGNFSTFDPELLSVKTESYGDFILGNVLQDTFESVIQTEKFQKIYQDMTAGVEKCQQNCQYFGVCGGGAGSNKYWENGTFNSTETTACKYRIKVITDLVLDELENSLGISG
ncbi:cyclophane-forming radical SAM/SPASM peptide maturase GrrM/OscB [Dapis sp. BLCC M229]|uniref:cyclophane-forming radical SAM/SPASM peptide maturase GrrM/OscB n=1 Tax=Dapis sp. BLCC M229 TaxID=3400188 RepID=UPI003CF68895